MTPKTAARDAMTPAQVAEYLQIHKVTVYRYIRDGRLPAIRIGRSLRILLADVDRFLTAHRVLAVNDRAASQGHPLHSPEPRRAGLHEQNAYAGPSRMERRPSREDLVNNHPLDWVVRGLH